MDTPQPLPTAQESKRDRRLAYAGLAAIVLFAAIVSIDRAARRPFWFDEILTIAVSTQPTVSDLWKALGTGIDHNPPLFHVIEHAASALPFDRHVAFRAPSIVAFCLTIGAVFIFIYRAIGRTLPATVAAILLVSTQLFTVYAVEARPYALIACLTAWAAVMWQTAHRSQGYVLACGLLLMSATFMHYYAVLAVVPLAVGEFVRWLRTREVRIAVCLACVLPVVPIVALWPVMARIRTDFGAHFWARPPIVGFLRTYDAFLVVSNWWGVAVTCGIGAALVVSLVRVFRSKEGILTARVEAEALVLALLVLPPITFAAARVVGTGVTARYLIPTAVGIVMAIALVVARDRRATLVVGAIAASVVMTRGLEEQYTRMPLADRAMAQERSQLSEVVGINNYREVPLAVTNGHAFMPLAFYDTTNELKVSYVTDSAAAIAFAGNDTTELLLQRAAPLLRLDVQSLETVVHSTPRLLVYGGNGMMDWLPSELKRRGFRLELIARLGGSTLYLAERTP